MKIFSGLSAQATFELADYSADDGYILTGKLINASTVVSLADGLFTGDGTTWTMNIDPSTTTQYAVGTYLLRLIASGGGNVFAAYETPVTVESASVAHETRTHNQVVRDQLRAVIEAKSTKDHASLSIDGQSIARMSWPDIITAEKHYTRRVDDEQRAANGGCRVRTIKTRFSA